MEHRSFIRIVDHSKSFKKKKKKFHSLEGSITFLSETACKLLKLLNYKCYKGDNSEWGNIKQQKFFLYI